MPAPGPRRPRSRALVALLPLALALVGAVVGLAVAPDVRAGWIVGGVTAAVVGVATIVAAVLLFSRRRER